MKEKKLDRTRNERQARRRGREKLWLKENAWNSWEALHTAILKGRITIHIEDRTEKSRDHCLQTEQEQVITTRETKS